MAERHQLRNRYEIRARWVAVLATLLAFASPILASAELGVGLVTVEFDDKTVIEFFDRPGSPKPARVIRFFDDPSINSWNIVELGSAKQWLSPQSLWLDYHSFVFRCRSRRPGWLEVIVNNESGKSYWIKADPILRFKTWEQFLKGMFSVTRSGLFPQKLLSRPVLGSREIKVKGRDCFEVLQMRGDWIRVRNAGHCDDAAETEYSGWLRWRRGNVLLVDYFITS